MFLLFLFSQEIKGQTREITVTLENKSVESVLAAIEEQTDYIFLYADNTVDLNRIVTLSFTNASINEILNELFAGTKNTFRISNRQVIIGIDEQKSNTLPNDEDTGDSLIIEPEQSPILVKGRVTDKNGVPLPGTAVVVEGKTIGTVTDLEGRFFLEIPFDSENLLFSFVGMQAQILPVDGRNEYIVPLAEKNIGVNEVVVVGYGMQPKASVVGSIVQIESDELQRAGGVSNLGQAFTGLLPGVVTIQNSGMPGADDPQIFIRGLSTWNAGEPLILVDGVERSLHDIDLNEVAKVSVLKDASATAVFGMKGAEGVILVTTKRGETGKARLEVAYNTSVKTVSRLPRRLNAYESLVYRNNAIERELSVEEKEWSRFMPESMLLMYKSENQQPGDEYIFPDVDWTDILLRDYGISHQANININGGSEYAKYFGSLSYLHEGDILEGVQAQNTPYSPGYSYDRFNYRTNLDMNITNTTVFSVNLSGYYGMQKKSYANDEDIWDAMYTTPPFAFPVTHENEPGWDGTIWGYNIQDVTVKNPIQQMSNTGEHHFNRSQITTDFILNQDFDFLLEGLSFKGSVSYDNQILSRSAIFDGPYNQLNKYISPDIIFREPGEPEDAYIQYDPIAGENDFDFAREPVQFQPETYTLGSNYRRLFYQLKLSYTHSFSDHTIGLMGLMNRDKFAEGDEFPTFREDWVARITYDYDNRYYFEGNGAYNGSEQFGPGYRFGFFPSLGAGWIISRETFMNNAGNWFNMLKLRYSIGKVGNDRFLANRWAYITQWALDDPENWQSHFGDNFVPSIYPQYIENVIGNPNLRWETAIKQNLGLETGFFKNRIMLIADFFNERREGIFMTSALRNQPDYFGGAPAPANIGKTKTTGYEVDLRIQNHFNGLYVWSNFSYTHAVDEVLYMEDPQLRADYRKDQGFQIGQTKAILNDGFVNNWDEVYATVGLATNNIHKMPGDLFLLDFNADGVIDDKDNAPYGYPQNRPQNTYNFSFGLNWKGFSAMVQFYGVNNVIVPVRLDPFTDDLRGTVFEETANVWTPDNLDAGYINPRFATSGITSTLMLYDGSFLRLKTAEIAYNIDGNKMNNPVFFNALKIFVNGNNMAMWTDLPDDRESYARTYPMFKRYNLGFRLNF